MHPISLIGISTITKEVQVREHEPLKRGVWGDPRHSQRRAGGGVGAMGGNVGRDGVLLVGHSRLVQKVGVGHHLTAERAAAEALHVFVVGGHIGCG